MTIPANIIAQWGEENLLRVPKAILAVVDLPESSKVFLEQAGLPKRFRGFAGGEYEILPVGALPPQQTETIELRLLQRWEEDRSFLLLYSADIQDHFLCVQEGSANVCLVDTDWHFGEKDEHWVFVNSDVRAWAECLSLYNKWMQSEGPPTEALILGYENTLKRCDPRALDEPLSYWSEFIFDARNYIEP